MAEIIKNETECSAKAAKAAVDALIKSMAKTLKKEGAYSIAGFGTLRVTKRAARKGRNPKTGEAIKIKASKTVRFRPSKALKSAI